MASRIKNMTEGRPASLIFSFALPLMVGNSAVLSLLFSFVLLLVLIVYRAGTPRGAMRLPVVLLSSLLAALAIVGASVMFSWFIGMSSRYALVYGSLASLIILLVWLYLCGNLLLLGAVIGRVLEARWRN